MTFKQLTTTVLVGLLSSHFSFGQSTTVSPSRIDSSIARIENGLIPINESGANSGKAQSVMARMNVLGVVGVSIAVFDQGRIIWARGYGIGDKETSQKVDTATLFQAASISKPITSVATFRLVERKLLILDEDVNVKLRRWKLPDNEFTASEKVTPRRIVSHMAGLSVHGFYGYNANGPLPTLPQILDGTSPANSKPVRVVSKPGIQETYSGGGFTILQLLLEDVTGKPFSALMNELVIHPIGMTHSVFTLKLPENKGSYIAKGYRKNGEMVDGGYHVYPEQAAAGLWTTPSDLARFMLNVGDSYRGNAKTGILQQATVQTMFTKVPGGGGLGFGIDGTGDALRFRHSGGNEGFSCYAVSFAGVGRGVVIMTNSDNGTPLIHEFVRAIAHEYNWLPMWNRE